MRLQGMKLLFPAMLIASCVAQADAVDWTKYKMSVQVTFSRYAGSTTLENFPVLVRVSPANGFYYSQFKDASGGDLRFSDADGNLLPSEIDTWDTTGESLVWVKVPSLNASTVITAHYGCSSPDAVTASDVWSNGYVGVWHLNESAAPMAESSGISTPFTEGAQAPLYAKDGAVGKAVDFSNYMTSKATRLVAADDDDLDGFTDFTLEMFTCQDTWFSSNSGMLEKRGDAWNSEVSYAMYNDNQSPGKSGETRVLIATNSEIQYRGIAATRPKAGEWTHQAFVRDTTARDGKGDSYMYVAGAKDSQAWSATTGSIDSRDTNLSLGGSKAEYSFPGKIDEVRISSVARSSDWLKATSDCVTKADFATYEAIFLYNDWTDYSHKFTVSFSGYAGEETLTDFPVLVKISESGISGFDYDDCLRPNGGDLHFADEEGNLLASEVDTWDASGTSLVWVKVPSLNASTKITAYYGNEFAPSSQSTNVWANGYTAVWHLNESGRYMLDSSLGADADSNKLRDYLNDGTVLRGQSGLVGKAVEFDHIANNTNELFHYGSFVTYSQRYRLVGSDALTFEVWSYQDDHEPGANTRDGFMFKEVRNDVWAETLSMREIKNDYGRNGLTYVRGYVDGSANVSAEYANYSTLPRPARAEWNYNVARYGSSTLEAIVNCAQKGSCSFSMPSPSETTYLILGNAGVNATSSGAYAWPGKIDEVRISSVRRSDDWLKATYDTVKNNATFTAYGAAKENVNKGMMIFVR